MNLKHFLLVGLVYFGGSGLRAEEKNIDIPGVSVRYVTNEIREAKPSELGDPKKPPIDNDIWTMAFELSNSNYYPMVCEYLKISTVSAPKGSCHDLGLLAPQTFESDKKFELKSRSHYRGEEIEPLSIYRAYCVSPKIEDLKCKRGCLVGFQEYHQSCRKKACTHQSRTYVEYQTREVYDSRNCQRMVFQCQPNGQWDFLESEFVPGGGCIQHPEIIPF